MHTTDLPSGAVVHHNGGYDGDAQFVLPPAQVEQWSDPRDGDEHYVVMIAMDDIRHLVACEVQLKRITALEEAGTDELLGIPQRRHS